MEKNFSINNRSCAKVLVVIERDYEMIDPAIDKFFLKQKEKRENWLPENWLPKAAKKAGQLSLSSHPCKFGHPASQKNKNGKTSSIIAEGRQRNDGLLRSGNVSVELDIFGNAAALDVGEFLTLLMSDGKTLLSHIEDETDLSKELLNLKSVPYSTLRDDFLAIKKSEDGRITSSRIKQVYFPIGDEKYHQLSILTPSGLMAEMHKRIAEVKFGDKAKEARERRRKNEYNPTGFDEISGLSMIGYGGTKPQNISFFNSRCGGKFYLLESLPPVWPKKPIKLPKNDFFFECLWKKKYKCDFENLHDDLKDSRNNVEIRNSRDRVVLHIFTEIIETVKSIRQQGIGWSRDERFKKLEIYQKHILDNIYKDERSKSSVDQFCLKLARWLVLSYEESLGKEALGLYDEEIRHFKNVISQEQKELW